MGFSPGELAGALTLVRWQGLYPWCLGRGFNPGELAGALTLVHWQGL